MIKVLGVLLLCVLAARGQLTVQEYPKIPSNFDVESELVPSWGTGDIAPTSRPDVVGAFRFICNPSHLNYDDPIVYPGQPGKSHLHQFFGNTLANGNSTYESLRKNGSSTCNSPLNRSAYWIPAMLNGKGGVVQPDYVSIYYKRLPKTDPSCYTMGAGGCVNLPRGLRFIFGYDLVTKTPKNGGAYFNCDGANSTSGHFEDIIEAGKHCTPGSRLGAVISAPDCWDGKNLDTPNHRDHVAYPYYDNGVLVCPTTHPYVIPTFTLGAWFTTDDDLNRSGNWDGTAIQGWHLSSDIPLDGSAMLRPGTTFHADWFGAWDDGVMEMWTDNCIDKLLSCSGGDLGNGKQLKMFNGFSWEANPRVVPVPDNSEGIISPYLGCYLDDSNRLFDNLVYNGINNTVASCRQKCKDQNHIYAGMEYSTECFCGDVLNSTKLEESRCSMACSGDLSQKCGGGWALSVYTT